MTTKLEALIAEALTLTPEGRVELADRLLASVFRSKDMEDAWAAEIERRIAAIDNGTAQLISKDEAMARVRAAIESLP